jgi:hypothetical protein
MIDFEAVEKSLKLYDEAKQYFAGKKLADCVIEISEKPMSEWNIHFASTDHELVLKRIEFSTAKKPFIASYTRNEDEYFFFLDNITLQLEIPKTREILTFEIRQEDELDEEAIIKEFLTLKKMLQNA